MLIQYGPSAGKLATIIDVVDQNRILVDGPAAITGVSRHIINLKWVALTDLKVAVARNARQKKLNTEWTKADTLNKWAATAWAKKLAGKKAKSAATDFERFTIKARKQTVAKKVKAAMKA